MTQITKKKIGLKDSTKFVAEEGKQATVLSILKFPFEQNSPPNISPTKNGKIISPNR